MFSRVLSNHVPAETMEGKLRDNWNWRFTPQILSRLTSYETTLDEGESNYNVITTIQQFKTSLFPIKNAVFSSQTMNWISKFKVLARNQNCVVYRLISNMWQVIRVCRCSEYVGVFLWKLFFCEFSVFWSWTSSENVRLSLGQDSFYFKIFILKWMSRAIKLCFPAGINSANSMEQIPYCLVSQEMCALLRNPQIRKSRPANCLQPNESSPYTWVLKITTICCG
jgi:hypothetical protein